ncbi:MAG: patatin-like phospholipase family protein [Anaerolineales bacterium]
MLAVVMSGASNFGAMQAGALEVLFQAGMMPEMAVGTSAGGLNAIWIAANPDLRGVRALQSTWRAAGPKQVGVPTPLEAVRRLLRREDSVVSSESLSEFLSEVLTAGIDTFGQLKALHGVPAYVTAIDMEGGDLVVFGDRDADRLLDGAMATTAIPPYYPPWEIDGGRYMDGGARSKLPILPAIARGATSVLALNVSDAKGRSENARGVLSVTQFAVSLMLREQTAGEIRHARREGIPTRVIELLPPPDISFWDYTQPDRLIDAGRELTQAELDRTPLDLSVPLGSRLLAWIRNMDLRRTPASH